MTHQMPLLHSGTQRNHKDFSSDVPSNEKSWCGIRCKTFWKIMVVVVFGPSLMSARTLSARTLSAIPLRSPPSGDQAPRNLESMSTIALLLTMCANYRGQKNHTRKKTNSWERRFPGTFRTNVPLMLPIFFVFSVGGVFILGGFSPSDLLTMCAN